MDSLQIGYSLLYSNSDFDYGRLVYHNIVEKIFDDQATVYFSRFCQILFNNRVGETEIVEADKIQSFQLTRRIFSDLINKDRKKVNLGDFLMPNSLRLFLQGSASPATDLPQPPPIATELDRKSTSELQSRI